MKKHIICALCAMTISLMSFAQTKISGVVTDKDGVAVPGAMVLNKDNGKWAVTDADGVFTLDSASNGENIEITCLGYATENVVYKGESKLVVKISDDSLQLEETVVIGYGSVKKKDLTGSVGVLNSSVLEQQSTTQLSQSLQGTIPGLQVTRSSSMPGASATLQVRGVTSMNGTTPLILVDGMAVSSIDQVASDDVEQITVLKDAASASIYGSRAAAGVILITTKSAKEGQLNIGYNGEYSMVTATQWAEYLTDPYNYMTMFNEYKWNDAGMPEGGDYQTYPKSTIDNYASLNANDPIEYPDFDWKNNIVKKFASAHSHKINVAYGNKVVKTRASFGYSNTDALYQGSNYERMDARIRNSINITDKLAANVDFAFKHTTKNDPTVTPLQAANMYPSIYLGLYPDGRIAPGKSGSNTLGVLMEGGSKTTTSDLITGNISLVYKPVEGLSLTAAYKPSWTMSKAKTFSKRVAYYDAYDTDVELGTLSGHTTTDLTESRSDANSYELSFVANYDARFGRDHNFNAMAGYEEYSYSHESFSASTTDMELNKFPYMDLANMENLSVSGDAYANGYRSVFARLMYNYKSRYYIQANVRGDGSSRFAKGYRWGCFPSVSLGWVMTNENWMENVKPISYLKLRASIGSLGNERLGGYYPYQSSISFNNALFFNTDGTVVTPQLTAAQIALAVQDISWETTYTYDVGFDINFFRDRLSLSADYYYKYTKDMLLSVEIPLFTGFSSPTKNAGTMYTNGWEAKIDWHDNVGDFTYSLGFNISDSKSVMGDLGGKIVLGDKIIKEGEEYYAFYGYRCNGILQSKDQLNGVTQLLATVGPGDLYYQDLDESGNITADGDKTILGSSLPHYIFGGYVNVGWKGLSLGILFNGVAKQTVQLAEYMVRPFAGQWLSAPSVLLNKDGSRNYWSAYNTDEQNAKVQYPRLSYTSAEKNNYVMSDYWLMDGSYFRVKNINLSYTVPTAPLKKAHIKGLKVYFNVDDPFCFDHYLKGWDPEQTTSSYIARTFTLGVDIKF